MIDELDLYDDEDSNLADTYLSFSLAQENYAIGVEHVLEIVRLPRIINVPDVPDYVRGVINLRGKVIPVMDIRRRFGLPVVEFTDRTVIIVLEWEGSCLGVIVDKVHDVLEIPASQIELTPRQNNMGRSLATKGMGKAQDKVLILLDLSYLTQDIDQLTPV